MLPALPRVMRSQLPAGVIRWRAEVCVGKRRDVNVVMDETQRYTSNNAAARRTAALRPVTTADIIVPRYSAVHSAAATDPRRRCVIRPGCARLR